MGKCIPTLILIASCAMCSVAPPYQNPVNRAYRIGWWTDFGSPQELAAYAAEGQSLVLATGAGWGSAPDRRKYIKAYLDKAQEYDIKVILGLTRQRHTPYGISAEDFKDTCAAFKDHPALYAWYIADEPELYDSQDGDRSDDWMKSHDYLATNPGYYVLAKSADPIHPVLISFTMLFNPLERYFLKVEKFLDVTDLVGMHCYPFWTPDAEFAGYDSRTQYDKWKFLLGKVTLFKKAGLIATAQALDDPSAGFRAPSLEELKYQVYSAIVLGVDKLLFFHESSASSATRGLVKQITRQVQSIGAEMNDGITNDPQIGVSVTDRNRLVYRHGVYGDRHVILAVNIAGREAASGTMLNAVRFSLPPGVAPSRVSVLGEDRFVEVIGRSFADTFAPFAVHIYVFTAR